MGIALVFTAVGDIFPPAERTRWQGMFAAVYGFASVIGPTLGGWLTDHGPLLGSLVTDATRWRWIFYVNLPVGILALFALLWFYPRASLVDNRQSGGREVLRRIDLPGSFLAATATVCLLLGLTWGGNQIYDWTSPQVMLALAASVLLFALFFFAERFASEPIVPLHLFRNQLFAADSILALMLGMILLPLVIYLPLYLQGILGESATSSGEVITPLTISLVIGSAVTGIVVARLGRYRVLALVGGILTCIGAFLLTRLNASTSLVTASIAMSIVGIGLGMFFPLLTLIVQNGLPRRFMGISTGAITYLRSLGQTLGVAIVGTIVNHTVSAGLSLPVSAKDLSAQARTFATNPQVLIDPTFRDTVMNTATYFAQKVAIAKATASIPPGPHHEQMAATASQAAAVQAAQQEHLILAQVFAALKQALTAALTNGFWCILFFCVVAFVTTLFLKDIPLSQEFVDEEQIDTGAA
jgi:MFS family permease